MSSNSNQYDEYPHLFMPLVDEEQRKIQCDENEQQLTGEPQGCIEEWKEKLKAAANTFEEASAEATKAGGLYANALTWEAKLKKWFENADDAQKMAGGIHSELNIFLKSVETTATNSGKTTEALQVLLCLVEKIFTYIVELLRLAPPADEKGLIQKLKLSVDCLSSLDDEKKQAILKCIGDYEEKVKLVYSLQKDTLNKLLELLNYSSWMTSAIGLDSGLQGQLSNLVERISGDVSHAQKLVTCHKKQKTTTDVVIPPCGEGVLNKGNGLFPVNNSAYYKDIEKLYGEAKTDAAVKKGALDKARLAADQALALKTSYSEAVKAAEKAETAK